VAATSPVTPRPPTAVVADDVPPTPAVLPLW
jgi:hypothetical protein